MKFVDIWAIYGAILLKIGIFLENADYLRIIKYACARPRDLSVNFYPINLKIGGMIY